MTLSKPFLSATLLSQQEKWRAEGAEEGENRN